MKRYVYLTFIGVLVLSFGLTSCEKLDSLDDYKSVDIGGTATSKISGEYFVTLDWWDSANSVWSVDDFGIGYVKIMTYNTASNRADSVWLNDLGLLKANVNAGLWATMARVSCDASTGVFTACTADNIKSAGETITVSGGKVIADGATTAAGNVSDSIIVEFEWSNPTFAGEKWRFAGYKRTGFIEDEH